MADQNEPKKETVRIAVPNPSSPPGQSRDTVKINLPPRPAAAIETGASPEKLPVRPPVSSVNGTPPLAPPPVRPPLSPSAARTPPPNLPPPPVIRGNPSTLPPPNPAAKGIYPTVAGSVESGPKKETARISLMPEAAAAPAPLVNMKKTQPLMTSPPRSISTMSMPPVAHPANAGATVHSISLPLCWALLGLSAVTFLIQIWNYFVG